MGVKCGLNLELLDNSEWAQSGRHPANDCISPNPLLHLRATINRNQALITHGDEGNNKMKSYKNKSETTTLLNIVYTVMIGKFLI